VKQVNYLYWSRSTRQLFTKNIFNKTCTTLYNNKKSCLCVKLVVSNYVDIYFMFIVWGQERNMAFHIWMVMLIIRKEKKVKYSTHLMVNTNRGCHTQRPMNRIFVLKLCNFVSSWQFGHLCLEVICRLHIVNCWQLMDMASFWSTM